MTDDLDELRRAMKAAVPLPDPAVRAAHLRAARENFARRQETAARARPSSEDHPAVGWVRTGVMTVIRSFSPLRATLVASTALVAVGVAMLVPQTTTVVRQAPGLVAREEARTDALADAEQAAAIARQRAAEVAEPSMPAAPPTVGIAPRLAAPQMAADSAAGRIAGYAPPPQPDLMPAPRENTETFANAAANPVKVAAEEPVSTFSIDVDTASYAVVRSSLTAGVLPDPEAVRIEDMVNYFPYAYPGPEGDDAFRPTVTVMDTPWNPGTRLVHIALQGRMPPIEDRPPLNLVFLIVAERSVGQVRRPDWVRQDVFIGRRRRRGVLLRLARGPGTAYPRCSRAGSLHDAGRRICRARA
jgi:Ca-activated chloride channel family protein